MDNIVTKKIQQEKNTHNIELIFISLILVVVSLMALVVFYKKK